VIPQNAESDRFFQITALSGTRSANPFAPQAASITGIERTFHAERTSHTRQPIRCSVQQASHTFL
jgi:hypothetical protein